MAGIPEEEALKQSAQWHEEPSHDAPDAAANAEEPRFQPQPAVRFKSVVEEIAPAVNSLSSTSGGQDQSLGDPGEVTPDQIRALSKSLKGYQLQDQRMNVFSSYQPFSLPASRTASNEDDSREPSRQATQSSTSHHSPRLSPRIADAQTPPLTPAGTGLGDKDANRQDQMSEQDRRGRLPDIITPRESTRESSPPIGRLAQRPGSSDQVPQRGRSSDGREDGLAADHRKGLFSVGPTGGSSTGSLPVSRETSPAPAAQYYTRPFTPAGDANDPYSASKRQPQSRIEQRFVFPRKKKQWSPSSSVISLPKVTPDKRHSNLLGIGGKKDDLAQQETNFSTRPSSMADLKRFFKMGTHHKMKKSASPASSVKSGTRTPPSSKSSVQIPFGSDHGLASKYGKLGRVLGAGAGGSVRLMRRNEDSVVFAVKEFRPRHSYETEREYVKKLTAEYCMGSSLHHGNIIETLDIVQEKGKWYEVMEYAPYDLFAIVMTGRMSREEISCCFLQILSGVTYLHSMGLAHRDMKLDNVVVSDQGIMKIIDFGSAHVFRYPFENGIVLASGIVGSDPYLAPEVYDERKYDPQAVDIWSLAIIYCCMTLRRFPWKVPRLADSSFKLFAADPTPGHDPRKLILPPSKSTNALNETPARDLEPEPTQRERAPRPAGGPASSENKSQVRAPTQSDNPGEKKEVIRGPWRILRLLPRESRHIIGWMLEIDPRKRAKMDDIIEDPWVSNTIICRQMESGYVIKATDHTHVLEPPAQK